jgi:hypothetical protein
MQKISSKDASALLKQAGSAIRDLTTENQGLREKIAHQERDKRIVKLAREMEDKGLAEELSITEKVANLQKVPDLNVTEEAIKLAAPQGDVFGGLGDVPTASGLSAFESYIVTGEDPQ